MKTLKILSLASLLALGACQQKPDEKLLGTCWNPGAKETVQTIATRLISRHIVDSLLLTDHGKAGRSDIEQFVKGRLSVTLSNFYLTAADAVTGTVSCGADAAMTFKRNDGKILSGTDASFSFSAYPSEGGRSMYVVPSGLPLIQLVDTAAVEAASNVTPESAAPASDVAPTATAQDAAEAASAAATAADKAASN
ncbi:hypothetical protein K788_00001955 [Paraburkholderia caribensis MBA4]|uniref:Lipoprotein n=1 Tax=Paraburkholderia caribensis MBA4 TaxID=1323664 RepID=A0A0P0RIJ7_9BURK|nr:hypothetical protein [Paraburkholderia caribensis]ALL68586.1 hypothetical protein K788_00001955 [Paraburkholderia caribensis MBA4]